MIKKALPYALELLKARQTTVNFVDVGSRNGILELRDIAPYVDAYGFEPNPAEYQKLVTGKTDLQLTEGVKSPSYRSLSIEPFALGATNGTHEFYVTPGSGACSLLPPNAERLREIKWKGGRKIDGDFYNTVFANYQKMNVKTVTLESFAKEKLIRSIDYLKIDAESSEYEVLDGARSLLSNTGVIKVEVCFIPMRSGQKMFSDVDILLREFGFELLRFETNQIHVGYKERTKPTLYTPIGYPDRFGQAINGDAIYVNRNLKDPVRLIAQAIVLLEKNYLDESLHILKNKVGVKGPILDVLRVEAGGSLGDRFRAFGYQLTDRLAEGMYAAMRWFR